MTRYLIKETVSSQAVAAIMKNPEDRTEVLRPIFESVGSKLEQYYVAYNENTVYLIADLPDQESLATIIWAFQAGGGPTSINSTPIMTFKESLDVLKKAGNLGYSPPTE